MKGQEKVILIQEQLSKNRVILELDAKGNLLCATSIATRAASSSSSRTSRHCTSSNQDRRQAQARLLAEPLRVPLPPAAARRRGARHARTGGAAAVSVRAFDFRPKAINIANIVLLAARDPERFLDDKDYLRQQGHAVEVR